MYFLSCYQAVAGPYQLFSDYWHSRPILLKKDVDVAEFIRSNGYRNKRWLDITVDLNGLMQSELKSRGRDRILFLPPRISYQHWLDRQGNITPSENRDICLGMTKEYIESNYPTVKPSYIEYLDLVNARSVDVKNWGDYYSLIKNDYVVYSSEEEGVEQLYDKNGLEFPYAFEKRTVLLPFCETKGSRNLASVEETSLVGNIDKTSFLEKLNFKAKTLLGKVNITQADNNVDLFYYKFLSEAVYVMEENLVLTVDIGFTYFDSLKHNKVSKDVPIKAFYPEVNFAGTYKSLFGFNFTFGYSYLNYFILEGDQRSQSFSPFVIHRGSLAVSRNLFFNLSGFVKVGILNSLNENKMDGFDYAIGINYLFTRFPKLSLGTSFYKSEINTELLLEKNISSSINFALSYSF